MTASARPFADLRPRRRNILGWWLGLWAAMVLMTVVIGGIIKTTRTEGRAGIPGLSSIPILSWLFKTESGSDRKEELLIFITPTIIKLKQRGI